MGTIRERKWTVNGIERSAWQLRYTDAKNKRHAEQFNLKRDAVARDNKITAELEGGIHTPRSQARKIEDVVPEWIKHKQETLRRAPSTVEQLKSHANRHILPLVGKQRLVRLTKKDVKDFFKQLTAILSPVMSQYVARSFRDLMKYAHENGYVGRDVAAKVRLEIPSAELVETDENDDEPLPVPAPAVIGQILSAASPELAAEVGCSALAGLRSEEVRALKWNDIDFGCSVLRVRRAANRKNDLVPAKSEAGKRSIPLSDELADLLHEWRHSDVKPDDFVFPAEDGTLKRYERLTRIEFYPLLDQLGIELFGWHQLRDFFASTMVAADIKKEQLKVWMGHAEYSTTEKYYVHALPGDDDRAVMAKAQSGIKISRPSGTIQKGGPKYLQLVQNGPKGR